MVSESVEQQVAVEVASLEAKEHVSWGQVFSQSRCEVCLQESVQPKLTVMPNLSGEAIRTVSWASDLLALERDSAAYISCLWHSPDTADVAIWRSFHTFGLQAACHVEATH